MLQDCLKMLKMLVFDRTRPSLYSGISAIQSTDTAFHLIPVHTSIVLMSVLRVLWMSTHVALLFFFPQTHMLIHQPMEPRSQMPPMELTIRRVLMVPTTGSSRPTRSS